MSTGLHDMCWDCPAIRKQELSKSVGEKSRLHSSTSVLISWEIALELRDLSHPKLRGSELLDPSPALPYASYHGRP